MPLFAKNTDAALDDALTENLPAIRQSSGGQIVFPDDEDLAPTRADLPYGYAGTYPLTQHGAYLGQVLTADQISYLMGPQPLPTPRPLIKVRNFFTHLHQSRVLPALGVLTFAAVSVWAHDKPYHPAIGAGFMGTGALLIRSGITAHKRHGENADQVFTRGAAATGVLAAFIGTGIATGMSKWMAIAVAIATATGYVVDAGVRHFVLEKRRHFAVGLVAAGNTGPALPAAPPPSWSGTVSDEESRLRKAFTAIRAEQVILGATRRLDDGTWYVWADLSDTDLTAEQVEKLTVKLATSMGARLVEIERGNRPSLVKATVYDGEDPLEDTIAWGGDTVTSILDPVPLGLHEDGSRAQISLAWKHTLVCGTTDMGKSGILNLILCKTMPAQNLVRILIDCKEGAPEFRAYKDVSFHVAIDLEDAMRTLAGIEGIYRYRGQLLVEKDVVPERDDETGETVQKWREEYGPFVLCEIDELTELTSAVPGAAKRIQSLRRVMRFVGLFAADATQFPNSDTFGGTTTARMNYLNRISLAIAEQGGTNIIFGQGAHGRGYRPDMLDMPGKFLMATPTVKRPRKARAERFEPGDVARMVAQWRGRVPDLDEGSADAFWEAYHAYGQSEGDETGGDGPRGGKPQEPSDAPAFGRPRLVVVPTYPDGAEIAEKDVRLWQLLGEFGRDGATPKTLAARAESRGHRHTSPPWVRGRLAFWEDSGYVDSVQEGREFRYWRTDLRSEAVRDGAAS